MIFQDPLSALTPVYTIGDQIVETMQVHHSISRADALNRAVELLGPGRHPQPPASGEVLPARVLRGYAAAGHDRHGHRQRPRRDHRRRADHGAGRDHPGAGPGGAQEGAAGDRRRGDHDHPRPRRGGRHRRSGHGHVRRSSGRAGHGGRDLLVAADAVHDRAAGRRPPAGRPGQGGVGHAGGEPAVGGQPAAGLPVRAALPDVDAGLHDRRAAAGADRPAGPLGRVHLLGPDRQGEAGLRRHLPGAGDPRLADRAHPPRPAPDRAPAGRHEASLPADEGRGVPSPDRHRVRRRRDRPGGQGGRDPRPRGRVRAAARAPRCWRS